MGISFSGMMTMGEHGNLAFGHPFKGHPDLTITDDLGIGRSDRQDCGTIVKSIWYMQRSVPRFQPHTPYVDLRNTPLGRTYDHHQHAARV